MSLVAQDDQQMEGFVFAHAFMVLSCVASLGYMSFYFSYVWLYTKFPYRFTEWGVGFFHPVPGTFINTAFGFEWVVISSVMFSYFPPLAGLWITLSPNTRARYDIHRFAIFVNALIVLGVGAYMIAVVWIFKSGSSFYPFSFSVPIDFCCKYHGAVAAVAACSNNFDCVDLPPIPTIRLHTDPIFEAHLYSLGVIFFLLLVQTVANMIFGRLYATPQGDTNQRTPMPLQVANVVYVFYVCAFLTCAILVFDVRYMHEYPSSGPIGIQSARGTIETGGIIAVASTALLLPMFMLLFMYVLRSTLLVKRWFLFGLFASIVFIASLHFYGLVTMMYSRGSANLPGYPNSLANHPLACCAVDTHEDPASQCDNTGECDVATAGAVFGWFTNAHVSSSQIHLNPRHTVIFGMTFGLLVGDLIIIFMLFTRYFGDLLRPPMVMDEQPPPILESSIQPTTRGQRKTFSVPKGDGGGATLRMPDHLAGQKNK